MAIQPHAKSYADVLRGLGPMQNSPAHPEAQAFQHVAKRRKVFDTSGKTVFNALHQYIKRYGIEELTEWRYEKTVSRFKAGHPSLFNWILKNGSLVRKATLEHGKHRNQALAQKVQEALYRFPLQAPKEEGVKSDTVFALIRRELMNNSTPEEAVNPLIVDRDLIFSIAEMSFQILQKGASEFSEGDFPSVREFMPISLGLLYHYAASQTGDYGLMWGFQTDKEKIDRLFEISSPAYWSQLIKKECSSWAEVAASFEKAISSDPEDRKKHRLWTTSFKELERSLSISEEPMRSRLLVLTVEFPDCREKIPLLFEQMDLCRREFNYLELIRKIPKCSQNPKSQVEETPVTRFGFYHKTNLYQASFPLLFDLLKASWSEGALADPDLEMAVQKVLKQEALRQEELGHPPVLTREILPGALSEKNEHTERFFYSLSCDYLGLEPQDWMQKMIASLPPDRFAQLKEEMKKVNTKHPDEQIKTLYRFIKQTIPFPTELALFKNQGDSL